MRQYKDSDSYGYFNRGNGIDEKLRKCLSKVNNDTILNSKIDRCFTTILRAYRESIVQKAVEATRKGRILFVRLPKPSRTDKEDYRFPQIIPFIKVKRAGNECVIVDISRYSTEETAGETVVGYNVDIPKLYVFLISAYVSLELCGQNSTLPMEAAKAASHLFARYFIQVLIRMGLLTGNKERTEAFYYFAIKFYLFYYINAPEAMVNSIAINAIGGRKSELISFMEDKIASGIANGYSPWDSLSNFNKMLYDNEVTGIRTQKARINDINESSYMTKFISMYSKNALVMLWSFDYFFFVLLSAYRKTNIVFDRAFEDVFKENAREMPKLMDSIYKEL